MAYNGVVWLWPEKEDPMKKKVQSTHKNGRSLKGLREIAQSFVNVGIPVIVETQIKQEYCSISTKYGNSPVSSGPLKIKL